MFIIPFSRDVPTKHTAWVVYGLILANAIIFLATSSPSFIGGVVQRLGFVPANHEPFTVLTSMFLHVSLLHILGNMFFLWMFGESVETALGHVLTLICYFICGAFGTGLHYLVNARSAIPCVGASGAISGMVGMYMVFFPTAKMDLQFYLWWFHVGTMRTSAVIAVMAWLGEQSLLGFIAKFTAWHFGIGFMAHVAGLPAGAALSFAIIHSGLAPAYRRIIARKTARCLKCPGCGIELPWLSPGHHNCWSCGTTFRVDEQRDAVVSDPSKPKAPTWLVATICVFVVATVAKMYFDFWRN